MASNQSHISPQSLPLRLPIWLIPNETGAPDNSLQGLASQLAQPCYGLAMPQNCDQLDSLIDLAAVFVESMKAKQPVGPYLVVGCSVFGCMVATAMVLQLER